ncbi:MAG TPA: STAS domain-containing protein [Verrucomicrobiae bacterium]|nr:STAS domain-containing protein [Verrucomicrobiae bacterium]
MLRITENFENEKTVRLRLDGTLSNEEFDELANALSTHRDGVGRTIIVDMGGVEFMNDQAARELMKLRGDDLRIIHCSPFIAMLLETIGNGEAGE